MVGAKEFSGAILLTMAMLIGGCTKYEYNVVEPAQLHVGSDAGVTVVLDPLEYRFQTLDNRLIMLIYNQSDVPLQLEGDRSSVVDPRGQSHPLRSVPIARGSFAKIIFPPQRPRVSHTGPSIGFGVGVSTGGYPHRLPYSGGVFAHDHTPHYLDIYDPGDALYWDWEGEGQIRLHILYDRDGTALTHDFVINRQKM